MSISNNLNPIPIQDLITRALYFGDIQNKWQPKAALIAFIGIGALTGLTAIAIPFAAALAARQWVHRLATLPVLCMTGYVAFTVLINFFKWLSHSKLVDYTDPKLVSKRLAEDVLDRCIEENDLEPFKSVQHFCKKIDLSGPYLSHRIYSSFLEVIDPRHKLPGAIFSFAIGPQAEKMINSLIEDSPKGYTQDSFSSFQHAYEHCLLWIDQPDYDPPHPKRKQSLDQYKQDFADAIQKNLYQDTPEGRIEFLKDHLKLKFSEEIKASLISKDFLLELIDSISDDCREFELPSRAHKSQEVVDALKAKGFIQDIKYEWKFKK